MELIRIKRQNWNRWQFILFLCGAFGVAPSQTLRGKDPPRDPPQTIRFFEGRYAAPRSFDAAGNWEYHLYVVSKDGKSYAMLTTFLSPTTVENEVYRRMHFPNLFRGNVVPLLGKAYRVALPGAGELKLERIGKDELPVSVHVPEKALVVPRGALAEVPPRKFEFTVNGDVNIWVKGITAAKSGNSLPTARIDVRYTIQKTNTSIGSGSHKQYPAAKAGDVLPVRDHGLRIREIVAPVPMRGVVGWVVFEPDPVKLTDDEDE